MRGAKGSELRGGQVKPADPNAADPPVPVHADQEIIRWLLGSYTGRRRPPGRRRFPRLLYRLEFSKSGSHQELRFSLSLALGVHSV